jgi:hypothetical protein
MSESLINSNIGREKQLVFLGSQRLIGVESLTVSSQPGLIPVTYAGIGVDTVTYAPRQEQLSSVSISSFLINEDRFYALTTGDYLVNMYIVKDKSNLNTTYSLVSGYFSSFEMSYSIGNVPQVNSSFTVIRDAGIISTGMLPQSCVAELQTIASSSSDLTGSLLIPYGNSIVLSLPEFSTNRVQAFNISARLNKIPIYNAGSKFPKRVEPVYPIDIQLDFSFDVGDYEAKQLRQSSINGTVKNISLSIGDYSTSQNICNYSFQNVTLVAEDYSTSVSNNVLVSQKYSSQIYR